MTQVLSQEDMLDLRTRLTSAHPARLALVQAYTKWSDPKQIAQGYFDTSWKLIETHNFSRVCHTRLYESRETSLATTPAP